MTIIATNASGVDPTALEKDLTNMDAGVLKDIPAKSTIMVNGTAMTPAQIDTQLQSYLTTIEAADTAKAQYEAALLARKNVQVEARNLYLQLKKAVIAYFGAQAAQLADFGLTPAKAKAARTGAQLAAQQAKNLQTRDAHGITSKKQRAANNPRVVNPTVSIAPDGKLSVVSPATPSSASSSTSSTTASTAASSSPATPAGGNTPSAS